MKRYIRWEELKINKDDDNNEENDDDDKSQNMQMMHNLINNHVITPFGTYAYDSKLNPMNDRVILIANTNFNLTAKIIQQICEIDGVESIRVISRYTVIVMIGALFDESSVVKKINSICEIDENSITLDDLSDEESKLIIKASNQAKYWLAYLFPNGKDYIETFDSLDELKESLLYFKEFDGFSDGRLFSSEKLEDYLEDNEEDFE